MRSPDSCSVSSWKRSASGTSIVSTSALWIASPSLRRYVLVLPLTSEIRTSGMARPLPVAGSSQHPRLPQRRTLQQPEEGLDEQVSHRFSAFAEGCRYDRRAVALVLQIPVVSWVHGHA